MIGFVFLHILEILFIQELKYAYFIGSESLLYDAISITVVLISLIALAIDNYMEPTYRQIHPCHEKVNNIFQIPSNENEMIKLYFRIGFR